MLRYKTILLFVRPLLYQKNHFSRLPLNFQLFNDRLNLFQNDINKLPPHVISNLLVDLIKSNRLLQRQNTSIKIPHDFLGITNPHSNHQLELQLYSVLLQSPNYLSNDLIIRQYLLQTPTPTDPAKTIDLIKINFEYHLKHNRFNYDIVRIGINHFLTHNDYMNCFRLLDLTLRSPNYMTLQRRHLLTKTSIYLAGMIGITLGESLLLDLIPLMTISIFNSIISMPLIYGMINLKYPKHLGRISWRQSNTLIDNIILSPELLFINRIITYFEENNETNLKNFHYSQVRNYTNLNVNRLNDYYIEAPTTQAVVCGGIDQVIDNDQDIVTLQQYFRDELRARKITMNDLPEELYFMEYWLTKSDNFEWVEPDQDPAEVINLLNSKPQPPPHSK